MISEKLRAAIKLSPERAYKIAQKAGLDPSTLSKITCGIIKVKPGDPRVIAVGKILGIPREKIEPGWLVPTLGNTYSGSSPMGLTSTLDIAKPGHRILMVSYGSGAGSDAFIFRVTDRIEEVRDRAEKTRDLLDNNKIYIDYGTYAKFRKKILKAR